MHYNSNKITGIYKILSPTNKVYIGQSVDIERRFNTYKNLKSSKEQLKLYRSFLKYGINNHIFEIVEECLIEHLNERERFYQEFYNVLEEGLNCKYTETDGKSGKLSEETKSKISKSNIGRKHSEETRFKISIANTNPSNEIRLKKSKSRLGMKFSDEHKNNIRKSQIGNIRSEEIKFKMSINRKDCKKVINTETGEIYHAITITSKISGIKYMTLKRWLDGTSPNKSVFKYLE